MTKTIKPIPPERWNSLATEFNKLANSDTIPSFDSHRRVQMDAVRLLLRFGEVGLLPAELSDFPNIDKARSQLGEYQSRGGRASNVFGSSGLRPPYVPELPEPNPSGLLTTAWAFWRLYTLKVLTDTYEDAFDEDSQSVVLDPQAQERDFRDLARIEAQACRLLANLCQQAIAPDRTGNNPKGELMSKRALALATLIQHPDWTDTQIAEAVGCNRTSLYKMPDFVKARKILKQAKSDIPRGEKNGEDGTVDAWDK